MVTILFILSALCMLLPGVFAAYKWYQADLKVNALQLEISQQSNVNPWKSQLMLMFKSGQQVPASPLMTKGTMLYGALVLEEAAETLIGMSKGIAFAAVDRNGELDQLSIDYRQIAKIMQATSVTLRSKIARCQEPPRVALLPNAIAREILDGCTDLHVVTAGLSIACGLPGQSAYDRVATSNLSKANPVTGIIDKDLSGKWIKGVNYTEPDLDSLLAPYYVGA